jgi:hypothetical protein
LRYRDLGRRLLPDRSFEFFETVFVVLGRARPALSFFTVDGNAAGLTRHALKSMDPTRKFARLEFNGVAARPLGTPGGESAPFARTLPQSVCAADHLIGEADGGLDTGREETRPASHAHRSGRTTLEAGVPPPSSPPGTGLHPEKSDLAAPRCLDPMRPEKDPSRHFLVLA